MKKRKSGKLANALSIATTLGQKLLIRTLTILSLLIAVAPSIFFLSLAGFSIADKVDSVIDGVATTATIRSTKLVSSDENNDSYDVVVAFQTQQGQPQVATLQNISDSNENLAVGNQLSILYKSDQPSKASRNDALWWLGAIIQALPLLIISFLCFLFGIIVWSVVLLTLILSLVGVKAKAIS
jgi:hypothetical protein